MPLSKKDAPQNAKATVKGPDDAATKDAVNDAIDSAAGAPEGMREAAEDLPEKDPVQENIKEALTADDAQTEAKAKAEVVDLSPDSSDTPSGHALKETAGISDDVERGEAYKRAKGAKRWGYVPAEDEEK